MKFNVFGSIRGKGETFSSLCFRNKLSTAGCPSQVLGAVKIGDPIRTVSHSVLFRTDYLLHALFDLTRADSSRNW